MTPDEESHFDRELQMVISYLVRQMRGQEISKDGR